MGCLSPLACPECRAPLGVAEVLDAGGVCRPEACLVRAACPRCAQELWAEVRNGQLALGRADRERDAFRPTAAAPAPDLSVRAEGAWLDCWYEGRYRRFPAER